ncbi:hypothetical protein D3C71_2192330 [compost metagenome]
MRGPFTCLSFAGAFGQLCPFGLQPGVFCFGIVQIDFQSGQGLQGFVQNGFCLLNTFEITQLG